jgi:hypothetical protein
MQVFLSHASADSPIADFLKTCLAGDLGVTVFMLPDDAPPGSEWIEQIRAGISNCDELFSLATPNSVTRPWISAEWACFWLQGKPCTPLLVDVPVSRLWEPMRAYQSANLLSPTSSLPLLKRVAETTRVQPADGVLRLAHSIAKEIPKIRERQRQASVEEVITRVGENMGSGTGDIRPTDVALLVEVERLPELIDLALQPTSSAVKQRQVAVSLVALGRMGEALRIARSIQNRAEARSVAVAVVRQMDRGLGPESEEWTFLFGIFEHLRPPQRRDVREELLRCGVAPLGPWTEPPQLD